MANEIRLIDANALLKAIEYEYDLNYGEIPLDPIKFADMVKDAPTVDAVPVVHGRWVPHMEEMEDGFGKTHLVQTGVMCSECGSYSCCGGNFCNNCGAKTDGDGNA